MPCRCGEPQAHPAARRREQDGGGETPCGVTLPGPELQVSAGSVASFLAYSALFGKDLCWGRETLHKHPPRVIFPKAMMDPPWGGGGGMVWLPLPPLSLGLRPYLVSVVREVSLCQYPVAERPRSSEMSCDLGSIKSTMCTRPGSQL